MMEGATMAGKKTGKNPKVARAVVKNPKFPQGSLVIVEGREDEGPFRVVSTNTLTVKCYREDGGKFEWLDERRLSLFRKGR
jgi:hypothetical protein